MLVTDAMPPVGGTTGRFTLMDREIRVILERPLQRSCDMLLAGQNKCTKPHERALLGRRPGKCCSVQAHPMVADSSAPPKASCSVAEANWTPRRRA